MIIDHEHIVEYWLGEPKLTKSKLTHFEIWRMPFPDLNHCSPEERAKLVRVLRRHPEYLLEIACGPGAN